MSVAVERISSLHTGTMPYSTSFLLFAWPTLYNDAVLDLFHIIQT